MDIALTKASKTGEEISFIIGENPDLLTGIDKLTQLVLITILTDPGTDKFDPDSGGGLLGLLGSPVDPTNISDAKARVTVIISDTQTQILSEQEDVNLPASERLNRIDIINVLLNSDLELEIDIAIINDNGDRAYRRL